LHETFYFINTKARKISLKRKRRDAKKKADEHLKICSSAFFL